MSRKVREEEEKVFRLLKDNLPDELINKISNKQKRIYFSEKTFEIIEKTKVIKSNVINNNQILLAEFNNELHICMSKKIYTERILSVESEVEQQDIISGMGILLINDGILKIKSGITQYKIFDTFFGWDEDTEFQCQDIFGFFDEYCIFKLNEEDFCVKYVEDIDRILCVLLFNKNLDVYGEGLYKNLFGILELESSRSIIPMMNNMLQTTNMDLIFLQLYRCLEYLYVIHRAIYLGNEYNIELRSMLSLLNNENIRYPEFSSMREIIDNYCDNVLIEQYYQYLSRNLNIKSSKEENIKEKVADYIYSTRCKIAHFKYGQEEIEDKNSLLESNILLSEVVKTVFQKIDERIIQINEDINLWQKFE